MTETKISPAFKPFLLDRNYRDKQDAIVVYRSPEPIKPPVRGRLREIQKRIDYINERANIQHRIEHQVLREYQEAGRDLLGGKELSVSSIGSSILPIASVEVTSETLPVLEDQSDVVAVMPNQRISLINPKTVDFSELRNRELANGFTWGIEELDIPKIWETSKGEFINVAVMDTGVYGAHEALENRIGDFIIIDPLGRRIQSTPPFDAAQHGTHVCGIIAGDKIQEQITIGVAPETNLLVAGVLMGNATIRSLMEGLSWAIENGADIINMSLGFAYYEPLFAQVFDILIDQYGILPVVAIGNENHGNSSSPGNIRSALSVGAIEHHANGEVDVAFFSSGASLVFPGDAPNSVVSKPDIVAPGAQVCSCIPPQQRSDGIYDFAYMDGTSMATPHVAGVAALLMAAQPEVAVRDVAEVIKETAAHPAGQTRRPDNRWGYGLIQPLAALQALSS